MVNVVNDMKRLYAAKLKILKMKIDLFIANKEERYETKLIRGANFEWKQIGDSENILTGYASVWGGPPDEHGDIVSKGAFMTSIRDRVDRGLVPLLDSHIYDSAHTLGTVYRAEEDAHGLKIWAKLSKASSAEEIRQKVSEGHLTKLSIGFETIKQRFARDEKTGRTVRYLDEVKLFEISVVPIPALDRASILSIH